MAGILGLAGIVARPVETQGKGLLSGNKFSGLRGVWPMVLETKDRAAVAGDASPPLTGAAPDDGISSVLSSLRKLQGDAGPDAPQVMVVPVGELLAMRSVKDLKSKLDVCRERGVSCEVDCSGASRVSTGGVQVLLAFFAMMKEAGLSARAVHPSLELLSALEDLGLREATINWFGENAK
jgi:anti-anti-sigma regulatory factor